MLASMSGSSRSGGLSYLLVIIKISYKLRIRDSLSLTIIELNPLLFSLSPSLDPRSIDQTTPGNFYIARPDNHPALHQCLNGPYL